MTKVKYKFNKHSLTFDKVHVTLKSRLLKLFYTLSSGMVFAAFVLLIAYNFFDSPKDKVLKREIEQYKFEYRKLNDRFDKLSLVLKDIEDRDDNIYRMIFEAEPIPASVREAGYGGVNRYSSMEGYDNTKLITETARKLDNITSRLYVQSKSFDEVYNMVKNKSAWLVSIPAIQPVRNSDLKRIGSYFGYRTDPFYKVRKFHEGVDFTARTGTPVFATGDGTVIEADHNAGGFGNEVVIDHKYSYRTRYAHLSQILVRAGQKVKRGTIIGRVGNTGKSTSPHLHYEVLKNGIAINPIYFFFNDLTPAEYQAMLDLSARPSQSMD